MNPEDVEVVTRAIYQTYQKSADKAIAKAYFWAGVVIGATLAAVGVVIGYNL